jgi:hypothetical protein
MVPTTVDRSETLDLNILDQVKADRRAMPEASVTVTRVLRHDG